jgi:hypothetical protein
MLDVITCCSLDLMFITCRYESIIGGGIRNKTTAITLIEPLGLLSFGFRGWSLMTCGDKPRRVMKVLQRLRMTP